jgi:DNA processing protein
VPADAQRALLRAFGSPAAAVDAAPSDIAEIVGRPAAEALGQGPTPDAVDATLDWLAQDGNRLLALGDADYPGMLLQIADPPTILFAMGRIELLNVPAIAMVGSRNASHQGIADAEGLARALSDARLCIVSGLALGIDAAAHRGGLAGASSSVAVVGTGLDRVYPSRNRDLAHRLAKEGALISEFPLGAAPVPSNFPRRNRLISGLSRGVLVVEAALKSGSLTTARTALDQGRDVFALPGSIHSPLAKGCHALIKQGAKLVESADDVLVELGLAAAVPARHRGISGTDDSLISALGHAPASLDALAERTGQPARLLAARLTEFELAGAVERLPGGLFRRLARKP